MLEKQQELAEVMEFFVQDEFNQIYDYLDNNKAALFTNKTGNLSTQVHMLLSGDKENLQLELYYDSYLTNPIGVAMPLSEIETCELGLQFEIMNKQLSYLKIIHYDTSIEQRKVYLVGIQSSQMQKWAVSLQPCMLVSNNQLDKALVEIKKHICEQKNIEYVADNYDSSTGSEYSGDQPIMDQKASNKKFQLNMNKIRDAATPQLPKNQGLAIIDEQVSSARDSSRQFSVSNTIDDFKKRGAAADNFLNYPRHQSAEPSDNTSNLGKSANMLGKKKVNEEEARKALAYKQLLYGQVFLKYGRHGFPKQKHVFFDGKAIKWRANTKEGHKKVEKSSVGAAKKKGISLVDCNGELIFTIGDRTNKVFKNFKVDKEREELSFTISSKNKNGKIGYTLNLQAATKQEMYMFISDL